MGELVEAGEVRPPQARLRRAGGPVNAVRFSAVVSRAICMRLESGESLRSICADPAMPHRSSVRLWAKALPVFAAKMERARQLAGWHGLGGQQPKWCEGIASEICSRIAAGETLKAICADPDLPSMAVVFNWRKARPEFAEALALARTVQAEWYCDLGWEIASAITPADAYATHVKLLQLRWTAGARAPGVFGRHKLVEAESEADRERGGFTVIVKRFTDPPEPGEVNYRPPSLPTEQGAPPREIP